MASSADAWGPIPVMPAITQHVERATIDRLTDPVNYLGLSPEMVNRALTLSAGIT